MSSDLVLRVYNVVKVLGASRVLRGLSATFAPGRVHVIEGANGSGKTTLLGLLGGRGLPTSGRILLQRGAATVKEGRELRSCVGWLGHESGLYPDLTALENIALHSRLRGIPARVAWEYGSVSLMVEQLANRKVRDLSRGQRQRVALLRALVGSPPILLLDEPSTGLDKDATQGLIRMLGEMTAREVVMVVVTHDALLRERMGSQVWRLEQGRLVLVSEVGEAAPL
ncbi:MAG: hypothetical protein NVS3B20_24080 [Polyangiales bacterium]